MWLEELKVLDDALDQLMEGIVEKDMNKIRKAVYEMLKKWAEEKGFEVREEDLPSIASGDHPLSKQEIVPGLEFKELLLRLNEIVKERCGSGFL